MLFLRHPSHGYPVHRHAARNPPVSRGARFCGGHLFRQRADRFPGCHKSRLADDRHVVTLPLRRKNGRRLFGNLRGEIRAPYACRRKKKSAPARRGAKRRILNRLFFMFALALCTAAQSAALTCPVRNLRENANRNAQHRLPKRDPLRTRSNAANRNAETEHAVRNPKNCSARLRDGELYNRKITQSPAPTTAVRQGKIPGNRFGDNPLPHAYPNRPSPAARIFPQGL